MSLQPFRVRQMPVTNDDYFTVFGQKSSRRGKKICRYVQVAVNAPVKGRVADDPVKPAICLRQAVRWKQVGLQCV